MKYGTTMDVGDDFNLHPSGARLVKKMLTHVVNAGEFTNMIGYAVYVEFVKSVYIDLWF